MEKAAGSSGTMYWAGPSGTLTETDLTGAINEEYIYFNGERIARVDRPSGTVHYYFSDNLGSASVIASSSGAPQAQYFYYPYGGMQSSTGSDTNHYKFTGKERDTESNLDEFGARYYTSSMGRFMTPDWAERPTTVPYAVFGDPQSLNLYNYVRNDPVSRADADGHCISDASGSGCVDQLSTNSGPAQNEINTKPPSPKPPHQTFVASHSKLERFLRKHVPGFSTNKFNAAVGNMRVVDIPNRSQGAGTLPLTTVTRNVQDLNTPLANAIPFGTAATTLTDAPGRPILLGPEFYGPAAYPHSQDEQNADMVPRGTALGDRSK